MSSLGWPAQAEPPIFLLCPKSVLHGSAHSFLEAVIELNALLITFSRHRWSAAEIEYAPWGRYLRAAGTVRPAYATAAAQISAVAGDQPGGPNSEISPMRRERLVSWLTGLSQLSGSALRCC